MATSATSAATAPKAPAPSRRPSSSASAPSRPRGETTATLAVDRSDPTATAIAFALELNTWDADVDHDARAAQIRASRLTTPSLAAAIAKTKPSQKTRTLWQQTTRHHGYTTATALNGGLGPAPADTATTAIRGISTTNTVRDSRTASPATDVVYVIILTRTDRTWSIEKYRQLG